MKTDSVSATRDHLHVVPIGGLQAREEEDHNRRTDDWRGRRTETRPQRHPNCPSWGKNTRNFLYLTRFLFFSTTKFLQRMRRVHTPIFLSFFLCCHSEKGKKLKKQEDMAVTIWCRLKEEQSLYSQGAGSSKEKRCEENPSVLRYPSVI